MPEEQPGVAQIAVELLAGNPGLDPAIQVVGIDLDDLVHVAHVDGDAAVQRRHLALERGAGAERDDRAPVARADLDDLGHLLGRLGEGDRVRRVGGVVGFVVSVLVAHGVRGREPRA
jgi:xanthine dehydrogenase iron-sulfur cluster and FAD-binding subunit A